MGRCPIESDQKAKGRRIKDSEMSKGIFGHWPGFWMFPKVYPSEFRAQCHCPLILVEFFNAYHLEFMGSRIDLWNTLAFRTKALFFSKSSVVKKLSTTNSVSEPVMPINACSVDAISQATGKSVPKATIRL